MQADFFYSFTPLVGLVKVKVRVKLSLCMFSRHGESGDVTPLIENLGTR
jgi:hypothetical protein